MGFDEMPMDELMEMLAQKRNRKGKGKRRDRKLPQVSGPAPKPDADPWRMPQKHELKRLHAPKKGPMVKPRSMPSSQDKSKRKARTTQRPLEARRLKLANTSQQIDHTPSSLRAEPLRASSYKSQPQRKPRVQEKESLVSMGGREFMRAFILQELLKKPPGLS